MDRVEQKFWARIASKNSLLTRAGKVYKPDVKGQEGVIIADVPGGGRHAVFCARSNDKYFVFDFNDVDYTIYEVPRDGFHDGWAADAERPMSRRLGRFPVGTPGNCFLFAVACERFYDRYRGDHAIEKLTELLDSTIAEREFWEIMIDMKIIDW